MIVSGLVYMTNLVNLVPRASSIFYAKSERLQSRLQPGLLMPKRKIPWDLQSYGRNIDTFYEF